MRRLGNKILLAMMAVIFAMAASFLIYFISFVGSMLESEKRNDGLTLVRNLAQSAELGILTGEKRFLEGPFRGLLSDPTIVYVMAYDRTGQLIQSDAKVHIDPSIPRAMIRRVWHAREALYDASGRHDGRGMADFYAPVFSGIAEEKAFEGGMVEDETVLPRMKLVGIVRIGMSRAEIVSARRRVLAFGIGMSLAVFLVTAVFVAFLARRITRPVVELREGATRIARGDVDFQIKVKSRDEIGELADSFNRMTLNLQKTTVSRNYLDNIVGSMIDTLVVVDAEGIIQMVNPALLQLLDYEEFELVGAPFEVLLDDPGLIHGKAWDSFLQTGVIEQFECKYVTKGGNRIPVSFSGSIMYDARKNTRSIVGVAHDTRVIKKLMDDLDGRRKETEQAKYEVEGEKFRLTALLSSLSEGVIMCDPDGRVVVANLFAKRLFRLEREEEITGDAMRKVSWLNFDEMLAEMQASPNRTVYREVEIDFPIVQILRISLSQVETGGGRVLGNLMVMQDVTEERQVDRMRDEFVATVSHDLRTPLTTIKGFVTLLLEGKVGELNEKQRQFLSHVEESAENLHRLINDLLNLSRVRSGKLVVDFENIDLSTVVEKAIHLHELAAEHKGIALKATLPAAPCMADADFERMKEVLANLISNAIKFTSAGGSINIDVEEVGRECEIRVHDTGVGIPHEHHEMIFEKFRSVPGTAQETSLSTGLGLSIVKGIVDAHRGRVWVESEPGHGSTFFVRIPKKKKDVG